jgi:hypothetical protein
MLSLHPPGAAPPVEPAPMDAAAGSHTKDLAASFFAAYGAGDRQALAPLLAPGAAITPMGGAALSAVTEWWVPLGGASRSAQARVTWRLSGGAVLAQVYRVELSAVSTPSGTKWFVAGLAAD